MIEVVNVQTSGVTNETHAFPVLPRALLIPFEALVWPSLLR